MKVWDVFRGEYYCSVESPCYWFLGYLSCPYLVQLTAGDLSLAEGPAVALPACPEEARSPWTWDCRLLGTHTHSRSCLSLSSALSAVKTSVSSSAHAWRNKATRCKVITPKLKQSFTYSHIEKVTSSSRKKKNVLEISLLWRWTWTY